MNYFKVVHVEENTKQKMRYQVAKSLGDNITVSSSVLSLAKVKLSQGGQYTCKPPGTKIIILISKYTNKNIQQRKFTVLS